MGTENFNLDYTLDWPVFLARLNELFQDCIKEKRCIPLPLEVGPQPAMMLLNSLNCLMCNANCCRNSVTNKPEQAVISVSESEKKMMILAGAPKKVFKTSNKSGRAVSYMNYPCPLLNDNRCSVYGARPVSCQRYPIQVSFQVDGSMPALALDSGCVQAPSVATNVYRNIYQAKRAKRI